MSCSTMRLWLGALLALAACATGAAAAHAAEAIQYNRDIRPILSENCFRCHGPDSASRKADLRLDRRVTAVEMGAIEPGKPGDSGLIARIFATDPKELMPPPATHKTLTAQQKDLLQRWVAAGAEYEPHWAYIAPSGRRCRPSSGPVGCETPSISSCSPGWNKAGWSRPPRPTAARSPDGPAWT